MWTHVADTSDGTTRSAWVDEDSRLHESASWDMVLTEEEIARLAGGALPTVVRPDRLRKYMPLYHVQQE